jgi:hypothetical protein
MVYVPNRVLSATPAAKESSRWTRECINRCGMALTDVKLTDVILLEVCGRYGSLYLHVNRRLCTGVPAASGEHAFFGERHLKEILVNPFLSREASSWKTPMGCSG